LRQLKVMARYVLEVMYDGTQFHGSQVQGDTPTVQLELNKVLTTLMRTPMTTVGSSRTDEGVHALSNYYHFDWDGDLNMDLRYKGNAILPEGLAIKSIAIANNADFNARFDATGRQYRYRIYHAKNPFLHNRAYYFPFALQEDLLHQAAAILQEYDHFESFSKRNSQSKTFTCKIKQSFWQRSGEEQHYVVEANRFLRGMVRGLVATQLRVARGKISLQQLRQIIESNDCTNAFFDVPGHGLYLEQVIYPEDTFTAI